MTHPDLADRSPANFVTSMEEYKERDVVLSGYDDDYDGYDDYHKYNEYDDYHKYNEYDHRVLS